MDGMMTSGIATFKSRRNAIIGRQDVEKPMPVNPLIEAATTYAIRIKKKSSSSIYRSKDPAPVLNIRRSASANLPHSLKEVKSSVCLRNCVVGFCRMKSAKRPPRNEPWWPSFCGLKSLLNTSINKTANFVLEVVTKKKRLVHLEQPLPLIIFCKSLHMTYPQHPLPITPPPSRRTAGSSLWDS